VYQTAVGRHGDRTRTAESGAVRNHARYHCAVGRHSEGMIVKGLFLCIYIGAYPSVRELILRVVNMINGSGLKYLEKYVVMSL